MSSPNKLNPTASRLNGAWGLLAVVGFLALVGSWGQPLLNSHAARQTQTAQTIRLFSEESWHPFLPKLYFFGKPGYNILELPVYQSLVLALMKTTRLPLETSGRLISLVAALAMAAGVAQASRRVRGTGTSEQSDHWPASLSMALIMSSPIVFASSQWISIEISNNALGFWAFVSFFKYLKGEGSTSAFWLFSLLTILTLAIKPNVIFCLLPLFVLASYRLVVQEPELAASGSRGRFVQLFLSSIASAALAGAWYYYGEKINSRYAGYKISEASSALLFSLRQSGVRGIITLLGRVALYVIGPGTLLILTWALLFQREFLKENLLASKGWILASLFSIALYLTVFSGANIAHNYYQLPTIFPVYLVILLLVPCGLNRKMLAVCAVVIGLNLAFSARWLMRQDKDWKDAIAFLKTRIPPGPDRPEILVVSNWNAAAPVTCYYLDRYGRGMTPEKLTPSTLSGTLDWIGICDQTADSTCVERLRSEKYQESTVMGRLWICLGKKA